MTTFNYSEWSTRYPEFAATVDQAQAQLFWNEATLYCDNSGAGPIPDTGTGGPLDLCLNMLTAHIAQLNVGSALQPNNPVVGRIANAAEGSVNVQTDNQYPPGSVQWYQQTKYGAAYWAATAQYRWFQYRPGRSHAARGPWPRFRGLY